MKQAGAFSTNKRTGVLESLLTVASLTVLHIPPRPHEEAQETITQKLEKEIIRPAGQVLKTAL